jgi:hypothetical protein
MAIPRQVKPMKAMRDRPAVRRPQGLTAAHILPPRPFHQLARPCTSGRTAGATTARWCPMHGCMPMPATPNTSARRRHDLIASNPERSDSRHRRGW